MSGAAGISAAKNRRSKTEPNQKQLPPPISCGKNGNGSCPPQNKSAQSNANSKSVASQNLSDLVNPTSLQILGPMSPVQILRLHEQRLNKFDERISQISTLTSSCQTACQPSISTIDDSELDDCFTRLETLESKLGMLEEVIMTLQNKLTIAQNFAMETNMSMTALIKKQEQLMQTQITTIVDITKSIEEFDNVSAPTTPIDEDI